MFLLNHLYIFIHVYGCKSYVLFLFLSRICLCRAKTAGESDFGFSPRPSPHPSSLFLLSQGNVSLYMIMKKWLPHQRSLSSEVTATLQLSLAQHTFCFTAVWLVERSLFSMCEWGIGGKWKRWGGSPVACSWSVSDSGEPEGSAPWCRKPVCLVPVTQSFFHTLSCLCWIFIIHYYSTLNSNSHHFASAQLHFPFPFIPSGFISSLESLCNICF